MMPSAPPGGGFSGAAVWSVSLKDDVTAVSEKMATSMDSLRRDVKQLGDAFRKTNVGNLTIGLKDARKMFREAGHNTKLFSAALKDMGVSALDSRLLTGKMSSELNSMRRGALGMNGFFDRVFNPRTIWVASHALNVLSKGYGVLSTVAGGAYGLMSGVADKALDAGKSLVDTVISSAQFRQNSITGMTYMLDGNEKAAKALFRSAQELAQDTPLDTEVIITGIKSFLTAGYTASESKLLAKVMADQGSKFLDDEGMPNKVTAAFNRVKGRGVATAEDLESFRVAGFNEKAIMQSLLDNPELKSLFSGVKKDASDEAKISAVKKVLGQGKIGSYTFGNAAIASLEKKGEVGSLASEFGKKSLTGSISNVKSSFKDLIQSVDLDQWPGVKAFQAFLNRITEAFKPSTESGKQLIATVQRVMDDLMGGLDKVTSKDIEGFIKKIGDVALAIVESVKQAWTWLDKLIHSGEDASFLDTLGDVLLDVGAYIGAGIWKGVKGGVSAITDDRYARRYGISGMAGQFDYQARSSQTYGGNLDAKTIAATFAQDYAAFKAAGQKVNVPWGGDDAAATYTQVTEWARTQMVQQAASQMYDVGAALVQGARQGAVDAGEIHSPSRVMARVGEQLVAGMVQGAGGGDRSGGGGRGGVAVEINVTAIGGDPRAIQQAIEGPVTRHLTTFFERLGAET